MLGTLSERTKSWFVKGIMVLIAIPFALFGVDFYFRQTGRGTDVVASVDGQQINQYEFNQALKQQTDRLRAMLGTNFDPSMLDSPALRASIIDAMVNERVLAGQARRAGLVVSDGALAQKIVDIPAFQEGGKFSRARYEQLLRNQGMSPAGFESRLRQDSLVQEMENCVTSTTMLPKIVMDSYIRINEQQRELSIVNFNPAKYLSQVKLDPTAAKKYYDSHPDDFRIPERVKLQYVVLSADSLMADMQVSPEEIRKVYEDQKKQGKFTTKEERQVSHILISVAPNATEAQKKAAKEKAEDVLKQVKENPDKFAELAQKYSQDPGSAKQGGDLGAIERGAMVKPFDDAVFEMQPGEIRGPVETEFGKHIIKLAAVHPGKTRTLEEATSEIAQELKKQKAARKFAEVADNFSNTVYEQSMSLQPAADAFKLTLKQSDWVSRSEAPKDVLLASPKLLQAVFSDEVLKDKRNTQAIEVAPNTLVAARVTDYKPAQLKPFTEVQTAIEDKLKNEEASHLAIKQGTQDLAELKAGKTPADLTWPASRLVGRKGDADFAGPLLAQVFKADVEKLPAYVGAEAMQGGYSLVRITKVVEGDPADEAKRKEAIPSLRHQLAQEEFTAVLASLRKGADVAVKREALEKKER